MSVRLPIDMNLSPEWVAELARDGHDAVNWSTIGDPRATDATIMSWARTNGRAVFTHDLDFGTLLALTRAFCKCAAKTSFPTHGELGRHCPAPIRARTDLGRVGGGRGNEVARARVTAVRRVRVTLSSRS